MPILKALAKRILPPEYYGRLSRLVRPLKDHNVTISPVQLRHLRRYQFAREHLKGTKLLDAACGSGYGADLLEPFDEYSGLDYADYAISFARKNFQRANRTYIEGDIYELANQFERRSFDSIVSFETLEHIDHPDKALLNFLKVLKPDGRIVMSIPLNHPDLTYHKKIYNHQDVRDLLSHVRAASGVDFAVEEFLQKHLTITPIDTLLASDVGGTWLGVLRPEP